MLLLVQCNIVRLANDGKNDHVDTQKQGGLWNECALGGERPT
jgi:hypothetical protein